MAFLDCYMAVTGLPEPRTDHAVAMCKFASECLRGMHAILAGLETTLGPGTFCALASDQVFKLPVD
jgi:hypothetical protein